MAEKRSNPTKDPEFKRVLGNLLNAPPKQHKDMKLGKPKSKAAKSRRKDELKHEIEVKNLVELKEIARVIKRPEE
jgi:hypothetical protein